MDYHPAVALSLREEENKYLGERSKTLRSSCSYGVIIVQVCKENILKRGDNLKYKLISANEWVRTSGLGGRVPGLTSSRRDLREERMATALAPVALFNRRINSWKV